MWRRAGGVQPAPGDGSGVALGVGPLPLLALGVPVVLAPANPTAGPVPAHVVRLFRWTTVFGQFALWLVASAAFACPGRGIDGSSVPAE